MKLYGLIGTNLSHSMSKEYFTNKFIRENLKNYSYELFELNDITEFPKLLSSYPNIRGLNVTIPYKESIIKYIDALSEEAKKIGAVNTIYCNSKIIGYNTDSKGFLKTLLENSIYIQGKKALIIGSGGAAKAVAYVFNYLNIDYLIVSRTRNGNKYIGYNNLSKNLLKEFKIIINCTPVGTYPDINMLPDIPYAYISKDHFCYDLIYNPVETKFLKLAKEKGAKTINGYKMLIYQAQEAWRIWNT